MIGDTVGSVNHLGFIERCGASSPHGMGSHVPTLDCKDIKFVPEHLQNEAIIGEAAARNKKYLRNEEGRCVYLPQ